MIEFLKYLFTGLTVLLVLGLLVLGYSYVDAYIARELTYLLPGLFVFALAMYVGVVVRGGL